MKFPKCFDKSNYLRLFSPNILLVSFRTLNVVYRMKFAHTGNLLFGGR